MIVDVQLLGYKFRFRKLTWREEYKLKPSKNQTRTVLEKALIEVSGLPVTSLADAEKVLAAMPLPVINRVYRIYRGSLPSNKTFETANLYCAPEPSIYVKRIAEDEDAIDGATDRVMKHMEQTFGKKELAEAAEIDRQILAGSGLRGAVKLNPEVDDAR